jgi:hypothetical protein
VSAVRRLSPLDRVLVPLLTALWAVAFVLGVWTQIRGGPLPPSIETRLESDEDYPVLTGAWGRTIHHSDPLAQAGLRAGDRLLRVGVTMCLADDDAETIATTAGRALPDTEVRCMDEDGKEVPRGTAGEIRVRGYNVMRGYFEDPEETAKTVDAEGWLHTGDVGVMDERGYLRITRGDGAFPSLLTRAESDAAAARIRAEMVEHGFGL